MWRMPNPDGDECSYGQGIHIGCLHTRFFSVIPIYPLFLTGSFGSLRREIKQPAKKFGSIALSALVWVFYFYFYFHFFGVQQWQSKCEDLDLETSLWERQHRKPYVAVYLDRWQSSSVKPAGFECLHAQFVLMLKPDLRV